jgi:hypothetical protein
MLETGDLVKWGNEEGMRLPDPNIKSNNTSIIGVIIGSQLLFSTDTRYTVFQVKWPDCREIYSYYSTELEKIQ